MKVIDLLNKIANGEEVPSKIRYRNIKFLYDKNNKLYIVENYIEYNDLLMELSNHKGTDLNYEVEVIEDTTKEDKKIEKLGESYLYNPISGYCTKWAFREKILKNKINEIIDRLNGDE